MGVTPWWIKRHFWYFPLVFSFACLCNWVMFSVCMSLRMCLCLDSQLLKIRIVFWSCRFPTRSRLQPRTQVKVISRIKWKHLFSVLFQEIPNCRNENSGSDFSFPYLGPVYLDQELCVIFKRTSIQFSDSMIFLKDKTFEKPLDIWQKHYSWRSPGQSLATLGSSCGCLRRKVFSFLVLDQCRLSEIRDTKCAAANHWWVSISWSFSEILSEIKHQRKVMSCSHFWCKYPTVGVRRVCCHDRGEILVLVLMQIVRDYSFSHVFNTHQPV